jgi:hypothetical protein
MYVLAAVRVLYFPRCTAIANLTGNVYNGSSSRSDN